MRSYDLRKARLQYANIREFLYYVLAFLRELREVVGLTLSGISRNLSARLSGSDCTAKAPKLDSSWERFLFYYQYRIDRIGEELFELFCDLSERSEDAHRELARSYGQAKLTLGDLEGRFDSNHMPVIRFVRLLPTVELMNGGWPDPSNALYYPQLERPVLDEETGCITSYEPIGPTSVDKFASFDEHYLRRVMPELSEHEITLVLRVEYRLSAWRQQIRRQDELLAELQLLSTRPSFGEPFRLITGFPVWPKGY